MSTLIIMFLEFFHIGLLSFGGGYATLPFLYHIAEKYDWYTTKHLADMIAVSSVTPGPVGVNVATYAGFITSGVKGAFIATFAVVLPSFIIVIILSKFLEKFKTNKYIQSVIYVLKPVGCGLLAAVGVDMFVKNASFITIFLIGILFFLSLTEKRDPVFYIVLSGIIGLIFGYCGLNF